MSNKSFEVTNSQNSTLNAQFEQMYKIEALNDPILNEKLRNTQNSYTDIFNYLYETYAGGISEKEYLCIIAGYDVYDHARNTQPEDAISNTINRLRENIKSQEL
jgi:hypothetical protein